MAQAQNSADGPLLIGMSKKEEVATGRSVAAASAAGSWAAVLERRYILADMARSVAGWVNSRAGNMHLAWLAESKACYWAHGLRLLLYS
jgi:hypothetical protein